MDIHWGCVLMWMLWLLSCFISSICPPLPFCITHHIQRSSFSTRKGRKRAGSCLDGRPEMMKKQDFWGCFHSFWCDCMIHPLSLPHSSEKIKDLGFQQHTLTPLYLTRGYQYLCKSIFIYFIFCFSYLSQH